MSKYTELFEAIDELAERIRVLGSKHPMDGGPFQALPSLCDTTQWQFLMQWPGRRSLRLDHRHLAAHCKRSCSRLKRPAMKAAPTC